MGLHLSIDSEKCMGCCACEIACKMEYELPKGIRYIVMHENEENEKLNFSFSVCRQCSDAKCVETCPTSALEYDHEGVVIIDKEKCIGCKKCFEVCPYNIPAFDDNNIMQKCQLCRERREKGMPPACIITCPVQAISLSYEEKVLVKDEYSGVWD